MPSEKPLGRLEDILDNVARIERFTLGMVFHAFDADERTLFATLHALLIISEAARKLGDEAHILVPGQPWDAIRSFGNVLRHEYDGVDPAVIWRIVASGELVALKRAVSAGLDSLRKSG